LPNIHFDRIIGVTKCYWTRVGSGPFRTEIKEDMPSGFDQLFIGKSEDRLSVKRPNIANEIRELGHEYGTTTGRPRRIGWMDLEMLKEGIELTGTTELALMHCDTISKITACDSIPVFNGESYDKFSIWKTLDDHKFKDFCQHIENAVGVPIKITSWGPDRLDVHYLDTQY